MNATVATVEATPDEGERLSLVTTQAQIQLMLRGYGDPASVNTSGATTAQIVQGLNRAATVSTEPSRGELRRTTPVRGKAAPQSAAPPPIALTLAPPKPKVDTNTVTVIRGREVSKENFTTDSGKQDFPRTGRP